MTEAADASDEYAKFLQTHATNLGRELLEVLIAELKRLPKPLIEMNQREQNYTIGRLRDQVKRIVDTSLVVLFSGHYPHCVGQLAKIAIGDGITAGIKIPKSAPYRHQLTDATGQNVVLVMADPDRYLKGIDQVRAKADQAELFPDAGEAAAASKDASPPGGAQDGNWELEQRPVDAKDDHPPEPLTIDIGELLGTLSKAGVELADGVVEGWTEEQRRDALVWAIAVTQGLTSPQTLDRIPQHVKDAPRREDGVRHSDQPADKGEGSADERGVETNGKGKGRKKGKPKA